MEDAGLLVDSFSHTTVTVILAGLFVLGYLLTVLIEYLVAKKEGREFQGLVFVIGILGGIGGFFIAILVVMAYQHSYAAPAFDAIEDHYNVALLKPESGTALYSQGSDYGYLTREGYTPVVIQHEGNFYEQARLVKTEEGDSMRFVLMFNPSEDSSEMQEFDAELVGSEDYEEF